ncbi:MULTISPECIES: flavin reductase family protein [Devosia]|mgnify:FL=1|uniref:flavin reductase family protein n=1 Tax=Devosia TaxID=46913 RepID=UPI000CE94244|nr:MULTISPECIES: flavin reductase family protein [Devosia]AVF05149.1 flavin reductase [Devosia sp. I507]
MTPDDFKLGMRRLAAGVSLITTTNRGVRHGLVATAVNSVTADPPTLLVCINKNASAHDHVAEAGLLCVNVLSDEHEAVAGRFSSALNREQRFDHDEWRAIATGAPALVNCLVSFDCEVRQQVHYGSHSIFLAEIVGLEVWCEAISPLLYLDGKYRYLGEPQSSLLYATA